MGEQEMESVLKKDAEQDLEKDLQDKPTCEMSAEIEAIAAELAAVVTQMKEALAEIVKAIPNESEKKLGFKIGTDADGKKEGHSAISKIFGNA